MSDTIDFSGVPQEIRKGGQSYYVPPGDYLVKIIEAEKARKDEASAYYYRWRFQVKAPEEFKGRNVSMTTSLAPQALFNLRNLIFAATGKNVAGKSVKFEPGMLYGKEIAVTVEDRELPKQGDKEAKIVSNVVDIRPAEEYQGDVQEADTPTTPVEEATEEDQELEEVDLDEL